MRTSCVGLDDFHHNVTANSLQVSRLDATTFFSGNAKDTTCERGWRERLLFATVDWWGCTPFPTFLLGKQVIVIGRIKKVLGWDAGTRTFLQRILSCFRNALRKIGFDVDVHFGHAIDYKNPIKASYPLIEDT
mmetsp:Transcript_44347/g.51962  ORF Transcript_44347/g.51962 Transcript_44347/m.51962 type:complete len:133 (-) Transcript_44347:45-443(-)